MFLFNNLFLNTIKCLSFNNTFFYFVSKTMIRTCGSFSIEKSFLRTKDSFYFVPVVSMSENNTKYDPILEIVGLNDKIKMKLLDYIKEPEEFQKVNIIVSSIHYGKNTCRKVCPKFLHKLALFFSEYADIEGLLLVKEFSAEQYPAELIKYGNYTTCFAQILWLKGDIKSSVMLFTSSFLNGTPELQDEVESLINKLISITVVNKGKAQISLMIEPIVEFSLKINKLNLLGNMWYSLFTSQWFEDQCLSEKLLLDYPQLKSYLEVVMPKIASGFLLRGDVSSFQRLAETTLRNKMTQSSGNLLRALFDYYYKEGYVAGCSAVVYCCKHLEIKLTKDQLYRYSIMIKSIPETKKTLFIDDYKYRF